MIIVDTNVIAYLLIPGIHSRWAQEALRKDSNWGAPLLWRSEFCSVLSLYMRRNNLGLNKVLRLMQEAEALMRGNEYEVQPSQVLTIAAGCRCSTYDCEYAVLARELGLKLLTTDKKILEEFPDLAVSLEAYVAGG